MPTGTDGSMKKFFLLEAQYNKWANGILYGACSTVSDEDYYKDIGAYFKSIHGTLNHMYAADSVWLYRFTYTGEVPDTFDEPLFEELESLREARAILDERILSIVQQMSEEDFLKPFLFQTTRNPVLVEKPLLATMAHFFNHQTHHRGQVHAFLHQLGYKAPQIDMIHFQENIDIDAAA